MRRFWITAMALLLWNIAGVAAYLMQVTSDPATLGDPATAKAFASMPGWAWGAYAVGVWSGLCGAVALLMRRRVAAILFAISLIGVVVQFGWTILGFRLLDYKGLDALIFPAVIIAITVFAITYAQARKRDRTLR